MLYNLIIPQLTSNILIQNSIIYKLNRSMMKHQVKYLECDKPGYHFGEALNMICLEQSCFDKALCCGACIEEQHKNHKTKPLKLVLLEAEELATKIKPVTVDTAAVLAQLESGKKDILVKIEAFKQKVSETISSMEKCVTNWYSIAADQIRMKTSNFKGGSDQLFQSIHTQTTIPSLLNVVQKIIALIPKEDAADNAIMQNQLVESITKVNLDINDSFSKILSDLEPKIQTASVNLNAFILQKSIWNNLNFKFSTKLKHNEIIVLSPTSIKAGSTQSYKFSLLEPEFKKDFGVNKIGFKIKETVSNWLAFGVCHKNIVAQKNYSFVFNSIGHGGYLISSNGGTWSHTDALFNNQVKTFKFAKGDTIGVMVNHETNKVKFKKKGSNDSYELDFVKNLQDPLYPCVLLYYPNDEVEVIENYSDW